MYAGTAANYASTSSDYTQDDRAHNHIEGDSSIVRPSIYGRSLIAPVTLERSAIYPGSRRTLPAVALEGTYRACDSRYGLQLPYSLFLRVLQGLDPIQVPASDIS